MRDSKRSWKPKHFLFDVDGVFTDGKIYYSATGKIFKVFGPDDHDAIKIIRSKLKIIVLTADSKGFAITQKRIEDDLGLELHQVSADIRLEWIRQRFDLSDCVYMGDGIFDSVIFKEIGYSIAPANASSRTRACANFVTESKGSEGAVAEAIIHVLDSFFGGFEVSMAKH